MTALLIAALLTAPADTAVVDGELVAGVPVVPSSSTEPSAGAGAPVVPEIKPGQEMDWAMATISAAKTAADEKRWGPFASIILMAALSLFSFIFIRSEELRAKLRPFMPEVAMGTSLLAYVAVAIGTLPAGAEVGDWWGVIGPALKTGAAAIGAYTVLVKRLWNFWRPKAVTVAKKAGAKMRKKLDPDVTAAVCDGCGQESCNPQAVGEKCDLCGGTYR